MAEMTLSEMKELQCILQEKYKDKWGGLPPESAARQFLWLYGELAEAADILKKQGPDKILHDEAVRAHFTEELCDVLMYFNDILICFDISPEEIGRIYREKHERNMNRW